MTPAALSNHLWQSTLFAALTGLITLTVRQQRARIRYWLWFGASVKFLIPFSLLATIGSHVVWSSGLDSSSTHRWRTAIEVISGASSSVLLPSLARVFPVLVGIWCCGFLAVLAHWSLLWRKMSFAASKAALSVEGREVRALRKVERLLGVRRPMPVLLSKASIEPGVFGVMRPVLMWPEEVTGRLTDAELEAILTHEVRHLQQRDNLTAAIHMIVEAIFWFHPAVWWMGARLLDERERSCDEGVLELGNEPLMYAEGILKVCEFCLASPLACMSGVAGGEIKRRVVSIMTNRVLQELGFAKKLLLGTAGFVAIVVPVAFGVVSASNTRITLPRVDTGATQSEQAEHGSVQASKEEMDSLVLKKVPPQYPEAAKKAHIQGEVVLKATIGKEGDVERLVIISGHPQLAPAAIDAVKQWKYRPYMKDGHAVDVETDITVNFTLSK